VCIITNSWTIAQIHGRVAKSRHLSKSRLPAKIAEIAASAIREFLLTLVIVSQTAYRK